MKNPPSNDARPRKRTTMARLRHAGLGIVLGAAALAAGASSEPPSSCSSDAPLSAAASRDALLRLQALNLSAPSTLSSAAQAALPAGGWILRVAHGQALGGYIGASIELRMSGPTAPPVRAWLALVETLPAGTEGSPVRRNLVRNVLIPAWDGQETLSNQDRSRFYESRPMSIPAGARPERLRVVGWVEDAQGRIRAIAQTQCTSDGERW
jgi:hypothetical protein